MGLHVSNYARPKVSNASAPSLLTLQPIGFVKCVLTLYDTLWHFCGFHPVPKELCRAIRGCPDAG